MLASNKFVGSPSSAGVLHIFAGERLQVFSDAVFSIIATLMVIPLKLNYEEVEKKGIENYELEEFILNQWSRYLVYLFSFSLVVDMWYSHVGIFSIIEQVDDVIIWLNLFCLLLISFLPYGTGLVSSYPTSKSGEGIAITFCALDLTLIGICMLVILVYAFRRQSLLHPEIEKDKNIVTIRRASIISVLITPCVSLLAMCFSFISAVPYISAVLFYSIGILSFFTRLGVYMYYKRKKGLNNIPCHLFNSVGSTLRTEAFSDGVFAIVSTLIVLDLTTENILSPQDLDDRYGGDLKKALSAQRYVFVAYTTSFIAVGLLWFVHYGMMHFIHKLTPALNFVNNLTLFMIGGIPFVSGIHTIFSDTASDNDGLTANKAISIRAFCVLLFLVGIGQLVFWTVALFQKDVCMSKSVDRHNSEALQFCKIMVLPIISFIIFWGAFSEEFIDYNLFNYFLFFTPLIFFLLKVFFRRHNMACKKVQSKLRRETEVNSCADERMALLNGGEVECDQGAGHLEVSSKTTSTHMRLIGKGEHADIEVT